MTGELLLFDPQVDGMDVYHGAQGLASNPVAGGTAGAYNAYQDLIKRGRIASATDRPNGSSGVLRAKGCCDASVKL